jgi:hypothetical protein
MKRLLTIVLLTVAFLGAAKADEAARPMAEMHGGCANFKMDLRHEFAIWKSPGIAQKAVPAAADGVKAISTETKYAVELLPHPSVKFVAPPFKDRGGPDKFSGLLRLEVPKDGLYGVSASTGLWIDVVEGKTLVSAKRFEMQTGCDTIFKSVEFPLRKGVVYWLQLNGSAAGKVTIAVTSRQ